MRHRPVAVPSFPIGENANKSVYHEVCPQRDYRRCFGKALQRRYPSPDLFGPTGYPRREDPSVDAAAHARRLFPGCETIDQRVAVPIYDPAGSVARRGAASAVDGPEESFVSSALRGTTSTRLVPALQDSAALRERLRPHSVSGIFEPSIWLITPFSFNADLELHQVGEVG